MRAVGVEEFGGPDKLRVFDIPEPHPGPGEVRIRVHAATVNPTDTGLRSGAYGSRFDGRTPPFVPGADAAGVISEVGSGTSWQVGDEVIAVVVPHGDHGGAYADQIVVPQESVVRKPADADFIAASTLPMNGLTAWLTLDRLGLSAGQTIAVTGGAGAYGGYVIQLAKTAGLRVIADAAPTDEALIRQLGADDIVPRGNDVAAKIRALVPDGVDGLADGAVLDEKVLPAIRDGGGLAVIRGWSGEPDRGITVHKIMVYTRAKETAALEQLRRQAEDGTLTLRVAASFPPEQAAEAHRQLEAGGVRGRLVLDFSS
jgi:NADPH2:quinone reductase